MSVVKKDYENGSGNFVICDIPGEYPEHLFRVLREKFPGDYQFHIFYDIGKLNEFARRNSLDILLMGEEYAREERESVCASRKFLLTGQRDRESLSGEKAVFRYQSAENIIRIICAQQSRRKKKPRIRNEPGVKGLIGIYSPIHRIGKTRFALQLGQQLAEKKQVLYLNLEGYSGEEYYFPDNPGQDLGTLLYYVKQDLDNPGLKISTMTGQMGKMDYIMPIENELDIRQVKKEEWIELLDVLLEECIYDTIILDLGDCVDGLWDILRKCSRIYTHYIEEGAAMAKLEQYEKNIRAAGYGDILAKTVKKRAGRAKSASGKRADAG